MLKLLKKIFNVRKQEEYIMRDMNGHAKKMIVGRTWIPNKRKVC